MRPCPPPHVASRQNETFMTVVCPICKSPVQELLHTGDAAAFHCPTHGDFKVADSVLAEDYNREEWEAALDKARQRAGDLIRFFDHACSRPSEFVGLGFALPVRHLLSIASLAERLKKRSRTGLDLDNRNHHHGDWDNFDTSWTHSRRAHRGGRLGHGASGCAVFWLVGISRRTRPKLVWSAELTPNCFIVRDPNAQVTDL